MSFDIEHLRRQAEATRDAAIADANESFRLNSEAIDRLAGMPLARKNKRPSAVGCTAVVRKFLEGINGQSFKCSDISKATGFSGGAVFVSLQAFTRTGKVVVESKVGNVNTYRKVAVNAAEHPVAIPQGQS